MKTRIKRLNKTYPGGHFGSDPEIQGVSIQCSAGKKLTNSLRFIQVLKKNNVGLCQKVKDTELVIQK